MNRRLRNSLCWRWFVLLLSAGRLAQATYHAALNFPPLLSLSCFERFALSTFFVYTLHTRWRAFLSLRASALHLLCSSHIIGLRARRRQRVGLLPTLRASRSGRRLAPLAETRFPHSRTLRVLRASLPSGRQCVLGSVVPIKPASSPAGMDIVQPG